MARRPARKSAVKMRSAGKEAPRRRRRQRAATATRSSRRSSVSSPRNDSSRSASPRLRKPPACRSRSFAANSHRRLQSSAAHIKDIDRAVLAADFSDMAEEPPRERLFDVLMRRIEILGPHREAIRSLMRSATRNPPLAMALNGQAVRSQQWMLTAAGIGAAGPRGMLRAQGLSLLFGSVLQTWVATTIRASPAPWRRLTGRSAAASALPACSRICSVCRHAALPVAAAPPPAFRRRFRRSRGCVIAAAGAFLQVQRPEFIGLSAEESRRASPLSPPHGIHIVFS